MHPSALHLVAGAIIVIALLHVFGSRKISTEPSAEDYFALLVLALLACVGAGWLLFYFFP